MRLVAILIVLLLLGGCQQNQGKAMFDRAIALWQEDKHEEAVQNFIALTKAFPEDALVDDSLFWIANIYELYLHDQEQAIRYYRSLTKSFDHSEYSLRALKGLARVYYSQGDEGRNKAILIYQKLQTKDLKSSDFEENQIALATIYLEAKQYEKARVELKQLIEKLPNSSLVPKAYHMIGTCFYIEGRKDLAEITFSEVDRKFQNGKESLASAMSLAQLYEEQDQLFNAIVVYESIIDRLDEKNIFYQLASSRIAKLKNRKSRTSKG